MKRKITLLAIFVLLFIGSVLQLSAQQPEAEKTEEDKLVVLWTSDDPLVADRVAFMYTHAAKKYGWFNDVTLIIWGPSAKLTSENKEIQKKLKAMQKDGVTIKACIACASKYDIVDELKDLGFEVAGMGLPLTNYLKDDSVKVLTF